MSLSAITGIKSDPRTFVPTNQLRNSNIFIGVEIEAENCNMDWRRVSPLSGLWRVVEDGSLRNNGLEFVFANPTRGQDIVTALQEFFAFAAKSKITTSTRTGVHVHVDVREASLAQLRHLCALYAIMEPLLFTWVGHDRDKNIFCLPWYSADHTLTSLQAMGTNEKAQAKVLNHLQQMNKYSALNLAAVLQHGTVEFRHMPTEFDEQRLLVWINILLSMAQYAMQYDGTTQELCNIVSMRTANGFIEDVFGPQLAQHFAAMPADGLLLKGTRLAQEIESEWRGLAHYTLVPPEGMVSANNDLTSRFSKLYAQ